MSFALPKHRPALMGVLNVTPDSFSDGGMFFTAADAIEAAKRMMDEGADLIDVGGESTRPGAVSTSEEEELRRVLPVAEKLQTLGIPLSIDTSKPGVAARALEAGAAVVNDVTGFRDDNMIRVCVDAGCSICIMHMQGEPRTMQANPSYEDVLTEVRDFLIDQATLLVRQGMRQENVWIDPGIGFGKTVRHNLQLLHSLEVLASTDFPVLIGVSRKSFIGKLLGREIPLPANERLEGTLAAQVIAQVKGARIIRAHDVKESRMAIEMAAAILGSER